MIRNLTSEHDWTFGRGKGNYLTESKEVMLNIKTRLLSFLNDCFFATNEGIDWWNLLGNKNTREDIIVSCRKTINATDGVRKLTELDIFEVDRKLTINYNVETIYGNAITQEIEVI